METLNAKGKHQKLVAKALKRQGVKKAYDKLEEEFSLLAALVQARQIARKTQTEAKPLNFTQYVEQFQDFLMQAYKRTIFQ